MKFKIIGDSCTDFTPEDRKKEYFLTVPLSIEIAGHHIVDDETFDQQDFLSRVKASEECPHSACPSPEAFMSTFEGAQDIYVITLTSKLSGSYNSACLAKNLYQETHPDVNIHIFDSLSASSGQLLIARTIEHYALQGLPFEEIVEKVSKFRDNMFTGFVLESLENLRKNGRLTRGKCLVANVLNIKPYMHAVEGEIEQIGQARGINKALDRLIEHMNSVSEKLSDKKIIISHCNNRARAEWIAKKLKELHHVYQSEIIDMKGISSLYADDGGIIIAF